MNSTFFKKEKQLEISLAIILVILGSLFRLLPHYQNATPIAALALFGGFYLHRKFGFLIPIAAMLVSDYFLGFYDWKLMTAVYLSFILVGALGFMLKKSKKIYAILTGSLISSIIFFVITNFSVWLFMDWYPKTFSGLQECYLMALPFFRNTLLGDLFYVNAFFGAFALAKIIIKKKYQTSYNENPLN